MNESYHNPGTGRSSHPGSVGPGYDPAQPNPGYSDGMQPRPPMNAFGAQPLPTTAAANGPVSERSWLAALLLCLFLGGFGVHRFYVGKVGTGILTIITFFGFFGIWPTIDLIFIIIGSFKDDRGLPLKPQN